MIDILRGHPQAIAWLNSLADDELLLPGFVVMELIQGCATRAQQQRLQKALEPYNIIWPSPEVSDSALAVFSRYYLRHNLGLIDALIGQLAVLLNLPLHTFNAKHYAVIPGLRVVQPYPKI